MFSDIGECHAIENLNHNNADIKIYASTDQDRYIKDLQFQHYFGCRYTSDELSFELFAYEFSNDDTAMLYFKNLTGKDIDPNPTFCDSSGMYWFKRIVVKENKAYAIHCKKEHKDKTIELINSCFKEKMQVV